MALPISPHRGRFTVEVSHMLTSEEAPMTSEKDTRYEAAKQRAEAMQGLFIHLLVYAVINTVLFAIDALTGGGWWFFWPLLGWGIGLILHVLSIYVPVFSPDWVERRARRELDSGNR
jgi:hypothetical protein